MTNSSTTVRTRGALTRKAAAAEYGISVWTVDELIASGAVSAKRMGRRVLVNAASMQAWFDGLDDA